MRNKKSFTLIEMLISFGLIAISLVVTSEILSTIVKTYTRSQLNAELEQQANFVAAKLDKELRNAAAVDTCLGDTCTFRLRTGATVSYSRNSSSKVLNYSYTPFGSSTAETSALTSASAVSGYTGVYVTCASDCFSYDGISKVDYNLVFSPVTTGVDVFGVGTLTVSGTVTLRSTY